MTKEEIVKHFISFALDDQVLVQQIRNNLKLEIEKHLQAGTSTLDIFNKLKSGLGLQDQTAIDAMVLQGSSMEEVIDEFLNGSLDNPHASQMIKDQLKLELHSR